MTSMKKVMQSEVRRTWEEKREKITKKVNFLQKKWEGRGQTWCGRRRCGRG